MQLGHLQRIKYSSPRQSEKFRQKLVREGVLKSSKSGHPEINSGRQDDFFRLFAEFYVLDWKGEIIPKDSPYSAEKMGAIFGGYTPGFEQVNNAIQEDQIFFAPTNGG